MVAPEFFKHSQSALEADRMPHVLELELIDGPPLGQRRWRLSQRLSIGRAETCALVLPAPDVSRQHAVIEDDADGWSLRDCGSQLGTRLNELALAPGTRAALHVGDVIAIGPWRLRLRAVDADCSEGDAESSAVVDRGIPPGSLAEQRLELLLRCAGEVAAAGDEQILADLLAEHALLGSGYRRAAVLWRDVSGFALRSLRPVAERGAEPVRFNHALIASAETGEMARIEPVPGSASGPFLRALCAPLLLDGHTIALLYLDSDRPSRRDHADAPTFCQALARLAALALANLRRLDSERERAALTADIERAREVQRRLLPDDRAPIGGVCCALHLQPGRSVAGDIADVIALPGGGTAALLGDVSGAGLGAGLVMASVQSFLRAELAHNDDPARAVARLNTHLRLQADRGQFVTLWLGVFDPATRRCRFVDAGHGHALRLRCGGHAEPIATRGDIPLGIDVGAQFHAETLQLDHDDLVLLYSDGLTEQRAPHGEPFGRERLVVALRGSSAPREAIACVLTEWHAHATGAAPDDDTTLLAIGWPKPPLGG